jgi:hypothetical protein
MESTVDIALIENQLHEKEQLVAALTERLEQAAEQLDRLHRSGADKGGRRSPGGGGLPAELVDEHKSTLEDLKRVIARWEDIQAEAAFGRIETQIIELRDLVVSGGIVSTAGGAPGRAGAQHSASHATAAPVAREKPAQGAAIQPGANPGGGKAGGNAWWEAQKAAMLGEPVPAAVQAQLAQQSAAEISAEPAAESSESTSTSTGNFDLAGFIVPDLPAPVNLEELSLEEAHAAIRQRDTIIQQLREPFLMWKASGQLPAGIQSIAEVPEPLKKCVADLEAQWQAKFRQVELDLSLERARLARDQLAVRQQQEALQKQSRNGGGAKAESDAGDKDEDGSSKRRWFRFMGSAAEGGQGQGAEHKK